MLKTLAIYNLIGFFLGITIYLTINELKEGSPSSENKKESVFNKNMITPNTELTVIKRTSTELPEEGKQSLIIDQPVNNRKEIENTTISTTTIVTRKIIIEKGAIEIISDGNKKTNKSLPIEVNITSNDKTNDEVLLEWSSNGTQTSNIDNQLKTNHNNKKINYPVHFNKKRMSNDVQLKPIFNKEKMKKKPRQTKKQPTLEQALNIDLTK